MAHRLLGVGNVEVEELAPSGERAVAVAGGLAAGVDHAVTVVVEDGFVDDVVAGAATST